LELLAPLAVQLAAAFEAVQAGGARQSFEIETSIGQHANGVLQVRISALVGRGMGTGGMVIVVDDLTEQRCRAEKLRMSKSYLPPEMVDNIQSIAALGFTGERREVSFMFIDVRPLATLPKGM